jgi:hypothetical protein
MGTVVGISCSFCAYSNELMLGTGELGIESEPMICDGCQRLTGGAGQRRPRLPLVRL